MSFFFCDLNLGVGWKKFQPHLNTYAVDTLTYKIRHLSTALSLSKPDNNRNRQICVKLLLVCSHRRVYLGVDKTFLAGSRSVGILIIMGGRLLLEVILHFFFFRSDFSLGISLNNYLTMWGRRNIYISLGTIYSFLISQRTIWFNVEC